MLWFRQVVLFNIILKFLTKRIRILKKPIIISFTGKNTGMVRVVNKKTDQRVLLKGMKGVVKDLAFAHCLDKIILGIVDEFGNLFVFRMLENSSSDADEQQTELLLQINSNATTRDHQIHRLLWCPYLPDEGEDDGDSSARLLVLTHGSVAEMWNIDLVLRDHEIGSVLESNKIQSGKLILSDHGDDIMDASFSPDGTALATASANGQVKFFQVCSLLMAFFKLFSNR